MLGLKSQSLFQMIAENLNIHVYYNLVKVINTVSQIVKNIFQNKFFYKNKCTKL